MLTKTYHYSVKAGTKSDYFIVLCLFVMVSTGEQEGARIIMFRHYFHNVKVVCKGKINSFFALFFFFTAYIAIYA